MTLEEFLLLYGSLGSREPMHAKLGLDRALQSLGPREISGSLYDLGQYPGLVLGSGRVVAELFKIRDAFLLCRLDAYEEFDRGKPEQSLFIRTTLRLPRYRWRIANKLRRHPMIDAWIYVYNQPLEGKHKIEESSWQEYKRKRQKAAFSVE
jgi:gamma-glutamylcyclotransferase (GGCT)/AIG2-like uncharacterized protein YtfP